MHLNLRFVFAQTFYPCSPSYLRINQTSSVNIVGLGLPCWEKLNLMGYFPEVALLLSLFCKAYGINWGGEETGKNALGTFHEFSVLTKRRMPIPGIYWQCPGVGGKCQSLL